MVQNTSVIREFMPPADQPLPEVAARIRGGVRQWIRRFTDSGNRFAGPVAPDFTAASLRAVTDEAGVLEYRVEQFHPITGRCVRWATIAEVYVAEDMVIERIDLHYPSSVTLPSSPMAWRDADGFNALRIAIFDHLVADLGIERVPS